MSTTRKTEGEIDKDRIIFPHFELPSKPGRGRAPSWRWKVSEAVREFRVARPESSKGVELYSLANHALPKASGRATHAFEFPDSLRYFKSSKYFRQIFADRASLIA